MGRLPGKIRIGQVAQRHPQNTAPPGSARPIGQDNHTAPTRMPPDTARRDRGEKIKTAIFCIGDHHKARLCVGDPREPFTAYPPASGPDRAHAVARCARSPASPPPTPALSATETPSGGAGGTSSPSPGRSCPGQTCPAACTGPARCGSPRLVLEQVDHLARLVPLRQARHAHEDRVVQVVDDLGQRRVAHMSGQPPRPRTTGTDRRSALGVRVADVQIRVGAMHDRRVPGSKPTPRPGSAPPRY